VLNTITLQIYGIFSTYEETSALALSPNGSLVSFGSSALYLGSYNGSSFSTEWTEAIDGYHCEQLMFSPAGDYLASSWTKDDNSQILVRLYDVYSGEELWTFETPESASDLEDAAVTLDMSDDGNWLALGSSGRGVATLPEVHVFHRGHSVPYYSFDMPGSCLDVRLSPDGNYLIAGGTHQHAVEPPDGGDLFMIDLDLESIEPAIALWDMFDLHGHCLEDTLHGALLNLYNPGYAPFYVDSLIWTEEEFAGQPLELNAPARMIHPGEELQVWAFFNPGFDSPRFASLSWTVYASDANDLFVVTDTLSYQAEWDSCTTPADPSVASPFSYELFAPYPNPFNPSTTVSYSLPTASHVMLGIYDLLGREVTILANESQAAGEHSVVWNAATLASGVYLLRLETNRGMLTTKAVLMK
jgi:hypothetical protein